MSTFRTLSDAVAIKDSSNRTLRFPRDMRSAGILGPLAESDTVGGWITKVAIAAVAGLAVFAALVVVFST